MKRMIQGLLLASTLTLGGTALAQQGQNQPQGARSKAAKGGMAEHRGFMVPTEEKAFLTRMHYINQQEIQLGQLAQRNAASPDVKSYAEDMVRQHTEADQRLMSYARGKGLKVADKPTPMNDLEKKAMAADKAMMEELQAMTGEAFDSSYMSMQVGGHDHALGKVMAARQADLVAQSPELTALLENQSQAIAQHRQRAHSLLGRVGPATAQGVGGAGGEGQMEGQQKGERK